MKRIITTLLLIFMALPTYSMVPGTVLEGTAISGSYTVSAVPTATNFTLPNIAMPDPNLFKEKGLPVIITFACGKAPWWALATGTGYVLIRELDASSCQLYCSLVSGSSYAIGEAWLPIKIIINMCNVLYKHAWQQVVRALIMHVATMCLKVLLPLCLLPSALICLAL
jgi:hypothetical protein